MENVENIRRCCYRFNNYFDFENYELKTRFYLYYLNLKFEIQFKFK